MPLQAGGALDPGLVPGPPEVLVGRSAVAELIFSLNLCAGRAPAREGFEAAWIPAQSAALPSSAREDLRRLEGFAWPAMSLIDFLHDAPDWQNPAAFADHVRRLPLEQFLARLFNEELSPGELAEFCGRPRAVAQVLDRLGFFSQGRLSALEALFADPEGHRQRLTSLVEAADTAVFRQGWAAWDGPMRALEEDLKSRLRQKDPWTVARELRGKPLLDPGRYRQVRFLASHLMAWPMMLSERHTQIVFYFWDQGRHLSGSSPQAKELGAILKVLADPTRLEILRMIRYSPSYGKELAERLGLTQATVSRHLDQLKAGGFLEETREEGQNIKLLSLKAEMLETLTSQFRLFLAR